MLRFALSRFDKVIRRGLHGLPNGVGPRSSREAELSMWRSVS